MLKHVANTFSFFLSLSSLFSMMINIACSIFEESRISSHSTILCIQADYNKSLYLVNMCTHIKSHLLAKMVLQHLHENNSFSLFVQKKERERNIFNLLGQVFLFGGREAIFLKYIILPALSLEKGNKINH